MVRHHQHIRRQVLTMVLKQVALTRGLDITRQQQALSVGQRHTQDTGSIIAAVRRSRGRVQDFEVDPVPCPAHALPAMLHRPALKGRRHTGQYIGDRIFTQQ